MEKKLTEIITSVCVVLICITYMVTAIVWSYRLQRIEDRVNYCISRNDDLHSVIIEDNECLWMTIYDLEECKNMEETKTVLDTFYLKMGIDRELLNN